MASGVVTTRSATAPASILADVSTPDWNVMVTLFPLARSNMAASSSTASRMAVELVSTISAARAGVATAIALRQPAATAAIFDPMVIEALSFRPSAWRLPGSPAAYHFFGSEPRLWRQRTPSPLVGEGWGEGACRKLCAGER